MYYTVVVTNITKDNYHFRIYINLNFDKGLCFFVCLYVCDQNSIRLVSNFVYFEEKSSK